MSEISLRREIRDLGEKLYKNEISYESNSVIYTKKILEIEKDKLLRDSKTKEKYGRFKNLGIEDMHELTVRALYSGENFSSPIQFGHFYANLRKNIEEIIPKYNFIHNSPEQFYLDGIELYLPKVYEKLSF